MKFGKRVDDGIRFLDGEYPDWISRVDLSTLNIGTEGDCLACQITGCGDFDSARITMGLSVQDSIDYGMFLRGNLKNKGLHEDYRSLTGLWKSKIQARLDVENLLSQIRREPMTAIIEESELVAV